MSKTPEDLKYTKEHEWVRDNGDGTVTVGITDHAQDSLGDLVFVELPEAGRQVAGGGGLRRRGVGQGRLRHLQPHRTARLPKPTRL